MVQNDSANMYNPKSTCIHQERRRGTLICNLAKLTADNRDKSVTKDICRKCKIGIIYRDIGCNHISGEVVLGPRGQGLGAVKYMFCELKGEDTDLKICKECNMVSSEISKEFYYEAKGLFQAQGFETALEYFTKAKHELQTGDYESSMTSSLTSVESTMRKCLRLLDNSNKTKKSATKLWKVIRKALRFDEIDPANSINALINTLSGVITKLEDVRSDYGDAHGKADPIMENHYMFAELALNVSIALSTIIIRRFALINDQ